MHFVLQVAQVLILAFAGLALLFGIGKSLESAERRGSNERCFYGLAAILLDVLLVMAAALGVRFLAQPVSMAIIAAAYFVAAVLAVLALIMSLIGAVQCLFDRNHRYGKGKLAGSAALLLSIAATSGLAWLAWEVTRDGVPTEMVLYHSPNTATASTATAGNEAQAAEAEASESAATPPMEREKAEAIAREWTTWFREIPLFHRDVGCVYLRDYNLRYQIPPSSWVRARPQAKHHELLALEHTQLPIRFQFSVEEVGPGFQLSTASLIQFVQSNYKDPIRDPVVLTDRKVMINGMDGRRIDLSYRVKDQAYTASCWNAASGGYMNRMSVVGETDHIAVTLSAATQLFTGLSPIRRSQRPQVAGPASKPTPTDGSSGRRS